LSTVWLAGELGRDDGEAGEDDGGEGELHFGEKRGLWTVATE